MQQCGGIQKKINTTTTITTTMPKVTQSICLDLDYIELLNEVKRKYHLKNMSKAMETIIRQWQMMLEQKRTEQVAAKETRKPVNPMVNP